MNIRHHLRSLLLVAGLAAASIVVVSSPAAAAEQNNVFSLHLNLDAETFLPLSGGNGCYYEKENYTRTHATAGNITFTATNDGKGDFNKVTMALMYTSNEHVFASQYVGLSYGTVKLANNWGTTKFHVLLTECSISASGWVHGNLYY